MNHLAVTVTEENGKSFQLMVDGTPLSDLLDDGNDAIPYWIVENDLPYFPPYGDSEPDDIRIVTVCNCGEYGCGHSHCRVTKTDDTVIFDQFQCDTRKEPDSTRFVFSRSNYDEVVALIVSETKKEKRRTMPST
jgi:hypothetical protein